MGFYILKRFLLIIPTLLGVILTNFLVVQLAPGGPIERILSQIQGNSSDIDMRIGGAGEERSDLFSAQEIGEYRGIHGVDPQFIRQLEKQFGFDQPLSSQLAHMIGSFIRFDFGDSYFKNEKVSNLILNKLPVSISLGIWTTLLIYLIAIPLGIFKAVRDGSRFDVGSSIVIMGTYAIPSFLLALLFMILFVGGGFWKIFPLRGLVSANFSDLSCSQKILDYLWHLVLPISAIAIGGLAKLTFLVKNSFLEELYKNYVMTARAKGLSEKNILIHHVFRNAMLVVIASFPSILIHMLFTSSLLIETLFSLDGLGLLGFEAALNRDYPVMFGTLYILTILGLLMHLVGDLIYTVVDRRIDLRESRS
jgi:microcin C transport system permease protein